jgi:hypothetical protein
MALNQKMKAPSAPNEEKKESEKDKAPTLTTTEQQTLAKQKIRENLAASLTGGLAASRQRVAPLAIPNSQLVEVFGFELLLDVIATIRPAVIEHKDAQGNPYSLDVQSILHDQLASAQRMLWEPANADLWAHCTQLLANAIRTHDADSVCQLRANFINAIESKPASGGKRPQMSVTETSCNDTPSDQKATDALAWAIIVYSARLNEQLLRDMHETAVSKGCCSAPHDWQPFFLPIPPASARQAFNEYVQCRWPIHVFALDPVTDEQNIADAFSGTREMQLALSLGFVKGQISARSMTRFARRIEYDAQTIALNRTIVGFSHGENTFGWRFYPRYQTPDIESNFTVLFRDMFWGGPSKDALTRQSHLEPGQRECTAIMIMPSFVPYITVDSTSNWFKLTNPKSKEFDLAQTMHLSRKIKAIQECSHKVKDAQCYRDCDAALMMRKLDQLSERMPLQSQMAQVPFENTLGGFQMFNNGVTDLAPDLVGWYGAPGIDKTNGTSLFLVGDHFSVAMTRVIVGGITLDSTVSALPTPTGGSAPATDQLKCASGSAELLSRQIMRVTIPNAVQADKDGNVDVHVATPYGVSNHLKVPVVPQPSAAASSPTSYAFAKGKDQLAVQYTLVNLVGNGYVPVLVGTDGSSIEIDSNQPWGTVLQNFQADVKFTFQSPGDVTLTLPKLQFKKGKCVISSDQLQTPVINLLTRLDQLRKDTPDKGFPGTLTSTNITITPLPAPGDDIDAAPIPMTTPLTLTLTRGSVLPAFATGSDTITVQTTWKNNMATPTVVSPAVLPNFDWGVLDNYCDANPPIQQVTVDFGQGYTPWVATQPVQFNKPLWDKDTLNKLIGQLVQEAVNQKVFKDATIGNTFPLSGKVKIVPSGQKYLIAPTYASTPIQIQIQIVDKLPAPPKQPDQNQQPKDKGGAEQQEPGPELK